MLKTTNMEKNETVNMEKSEKKEKFLDLGRRSLREFDNNINLKHGFYNSLSNINELENLDSLSGDMVIIRKADEDFSVIKNSLEEASGGDKKDKAIKIITMLNEGEIDLKILSAKQLAFTFSILKNGSQFEEMIDLYESSSDDSFLHSAKIKEFLAVAYHKSGEKKYKAGNTDEAEMLINKSETVLNDLIANGAGNGEVFAIKSKIYKLKMEILSEGNSDSPKEELLKKSIEMAEQGFLTGFEFYPGINLVYNQITKASKEKDIVAVQKSLKLAELVYLSTQKAGGFQSNDFWTVTTMLESSILQGEQNKRVLDRVLDLAQVSWEIDAPIQNLNRLKNQLEQFLPSQNIENIIKNIELTNIKLEKRKEEIQNGSDRTKGSEEREEESLSNQIFENGFSYGEIASFSGGNINYGGQLHDHVVNRWDVDLTKQILEELDLSEIDDFNQFNKVIDEVIRKQYGTKGLEDLLSPEHKNFDTFMKNFNKMFLVDKKADSSTNVMVDFWLGKGDCRQHAYTKQLFFDVWKIGRVNKHIEIAYNALDFNNTEKYLEAVEKAKDLINLKMLVFDSTIESQIKINSKYSPMRNSSGELIKSEKVEEVEDHTWNGLAKSNDDGTISEFFMVDSFYQKEYQFGGIESVGKDGQIVHGVVIEDISRFGDKEGFKCGYVDVVNDSGKKEKVEVRMVPAVYAGDRSSRMKSFDDDLGLPQMRGSLINEEINVKEFFSEDIRGSIDDMVEKVINN